MAVDEKYIKQEYYTILTNADTGRIAMMCRSMDYPTLVVALLRFGCDTLDRVRTVTRDLSPTFESVCSMVFPEAVQTADKFHVVTHLTKAIQDYRVRLKKDAERHERKAAKKHAEKYRENASRPASERIPMRKKYQVPRLPNGETRAELLHRSRYLLYKSPGDWTVSQRQRARIEGLAVPHSRGAAGHRRRRRREYGLGSSAFRRAGAECVDSAGGHHLPPV